MLVKLAAKYEFWMATYIISLGREVLGFGYVCQGMSVDASEILPKLASWIIKFDKTLVNSGDMLTTQ